MPSTTNYELPLVSRDEKVMTFLEWRTLVNGTEQNSAMNKIDSALKTLSDRVSGSAAGISYNSTTGEICLISSTGSSIGQPITLDVYTKSRMDSILDNYKTESQINDLIDTKLNGGTNRYMRENDVITEISSRVAGSDGYLKDYYDKTTVDDKISHIDISSRLNDYATKDSVYTRNQTYTKEEVDNLVGSSATPPDMTNYYTKSETNQQISNATSSIMSTVSSGYYTKAQVDNAISNVSVDLSTLADNTNIGISGARTIREMNTDIITLQSGMSSALIDVESAPNAEDTTKTDITFTLGDESTKTITIAGGGGGGGGSTYAVIVSNQYATGSRRITAVSGQTIVLPFLFRVYFNGTEISQGQEEALMTAQYRIGNGAWYTFIENETVTNGNMIRKNVSKYLRGGNVTSVQFSLTLDSDNTIVRTIQYDITCLEISMNSSYTSGSMYTADFNIPFTCIGRGIQKTLHVVMDGDTNNEKTVNLGTSSGEELSYRVTASEFNLTYGAHVIEMYFVATEVDLPSNTLKYIFFYNDGTSNNTMIGAYLDNKNVIYGDVLTINYIVNNPRGEGIDTVTFDTGYLDNNNNFIIVESYAENNVGNFVMSTKQLLDYPESGNCLVDIKCYSGGVITRNISLPFYVTQSDISYNQINTDLIYMYKANGRSNNSNDKERYIYKIDESENKKIYTTFDQFNWASDGYSETNTLVLRDQARMKIYLPVLKSSGTNRASLFGEASDTTIQFDSKQNAVMTDVGRTIEFDLNMTDVINQNTSVVEYSDANSGASFKITPQMCYLLARGQTINTDETGFILNEENIACAYLKDNKRLRVSFVIEPVKTSTYMDTNNVERTIEIQCVNIYVNGAYAKSYRYNSSLNYDSNYATQNDCIIKIGSSECTTKLYEVRIYNKALSYRGILQNYMNAPISMSDRRENNIANDFLESESFDVSYAKAVYQYPCLLHIGEFAPSKTDEKKCGWVLTKPVLDSSGKPTGEYSTEFKCVDQINGVFVSSNKVQGTTSQKYPRKNLKAKLAKVSSTDPTKSEKVKYPIDGYNDQGGALSTKESTLCFKMDFMSTDHANTFNSNLADTLFKDKEPGSMIQNTVHGFRCLLFHMDASDFNPAKTNFANLNDYPEDTISFAGDGCLNNDKGNADSFGLKTSTPFTYHGTEYSKDTGNVTKQQKWEVKINSGEIVVFQNDDFFAEGAGQLVNGEIVPTTKVFDSLESCYPDQGDLEDENLQPIYDHIQVLWTWVVQRANFLDPNIDSTTKAARRAIFRNEFQKHFNLDHALVYYLFTEWTALCDNRAKNMFLSCKDITKENIVFTNGATSLSNIQTSAGRLDGSKINWNDSTFAVWFTDLYDLDSCFGADNVGYLRIPYYADWYYYTGTKGEQSYSEKFSGAQSYFWKMFEDEFAAEIKAKAQDITRPSTEYGDLSYETLKRIHITDNAELVCPAIINRDMEYKYDDTWVEGFYNPVTQKHEHDDQYKYIHRGSRTEQKDSFIYKRSRMLYSKYQCDQFTQDNLSFRCGAAIDRNNTGIVVEADQKMYLGVRYGDSAPNMTNSMINAGVSASFISPSGCGATDTVYVLGASNLTKISDISKFIPQELKIGNATKIKELIVGSDASGYTNSVLSSLNTTNNALLETLNLCGCVGMDSVLNLSNNSLIKNVYLKNSSITTVTLPIGGVLKNLQLEKPYNLTVRNMTKLESLTYTSLENIKTLYIENTPNTNVFLILMRAFDTLDQIRIVNVNETLTNDMLRSNESWDDLYDILLSSHMEGKYIGSDGRSGSGRPVISGTLHVPSIGNLTKQKIESIYDLVITADTVIPEFEIKFVNNDSTVLYTEYLKQYETPVDPYPIGSGEKLIDEPHKYVAPDDEDAAHYSYTFAGFTPSLVPATANAVYTASYTASPRDQIVKWYNGTTLLQEKSVGYGSSAEYTGTMPVKAKNGDTCYVFDHWDKSTGYVNGDMSVYAVFTEGHPYTKTQLDEMNKEFIDLEPADIYAMTQKGVFTSNPDDSLNHNAASDYYHIAESSLNTELNITMGNDYDFDNVTSNEFVPLGGTLTFTSESNGIRTNSALFDEDKSFTLAVDYQFTSGSANQVLMACTNISFGVQLMQTSNGPAIQYHGTTYNLVNGDAEALTRNIVVIKHTKGSNNIDIYYSDIEDASYAPKKITTTWSGSYTTNAVLSFGAKFATDGAVSNRANGKIYWAKLWNNDLGDSVAKMIAMWPRETYRFRVSGTDIDNFRLYQRADSDEQYAGIVFYMSNCLSTEVYGTNQTSGYSNILYANTLIHPYLNNRIINALPVKWRNVIAQVKVPYLNSNNSQLLTVSAKLFAPSYRELFYSDSVPVENIISDDPQINYCVTDSGRTKTKGDNGNTIGYWTRTRVGSSNRFLYIINDIGSPSVYAYPDGKYGLTFGFAM